MIRIGICDDDQEFINELKKELDQVLFQRTDYVYDEFHSGEEVIEAIEKKKFRSELLFMDIYMKTVSGVDVAKYICEQEIDTDLFFITRSESHVYECFRYRCRPFNRLGQRRQHRL